MKRRCQNALELVYRSFEQRDHSRTVSFEAPIYAGISACEYGQPHSQDRSIRYQRATIFTIARELWVVSLGNTEFGAFRSDLLAMTLRGRSLESNTLNLVRSIQFAFSEVHSFQRSCLVACADGRFSVNYRSSRLGERVFETLKCKGEGLFACQDTEDGDFRYIEPCVQDDREVSAFLSQQLLNIFVGLSS